MRIYPVLFSLLFCLCLTTQSPAQNPGAQQDAEAAREKLLKAADQLDNIQANSETTRTSVDGMKGEITQLHADVTKLQGDNAALKQQVSDLQNQLAEYKATYEKQQKVMVDTIAGMIASKKGTDSTKPAKKKDKEPAAAASTPEVKAPATAPAAVTTPATETAAATAPPVDPAPAPGPVKTQKGYYHVVASGETLTLICNAYKQEGVNVTVPDIQKANGLTDKSVLKVGQKLFIPKPGT